MVVKTLCHVFLLIVFFSAVSFCCVKLMDDYMRKKIGILGEVAERNSCLFVVGLFFSHLFWFTSSCPLGCDVWLVTLAHCLSFPYIFLMCIAYPRT